MQERLEEAFRRVRPDVDACSLRVQEDRTEMVEVRQDVLLPVPSRHESGAMATVFHKGGIGYAATADLSDAGLRQAFDRASRWAERTAGRAVTDFSQMPVSEERGDYVSSSEKPWADTDLATKVELARQESARLKIGPEIVDWSAGFQSVRSDTLLLTSRDGAVRQRTECLLPKLQVTAAGQSKAESRTLGGHGIGRQGGLEILDQVGFHTVGPRLAQEAVELLHAPDCPTGVMDIVLAPDQMVLQIHESIGHPLELDRILGDERNYAGTSFVTLDMFGQYQYGSELLNVTFDPTVPGELVSYGFDDEGQRAERTYIIKNGLLTRPLGGAVSQARAGIGGTATSRASSWYRAPIDRMANLNVEPGTSSLEEMIGSIERGVYMASNCSWSIDDSRNKFQFGCEYGRMIENGKLTHVVRKPNYRGISATFWRNLKMVGDTATHEVLGVANCGKGEPNQVVRVGHASPTCLFSNVEVFGGA